MNRGLGMTLRILGVAVGTLFVAFGPFDLWAETHLSFQRVASALSMMLTGAVFIRYGLTGESRGPNLPIPARIALSFSLGVVALVLGPYFLTKHASYGVVSIALCVAYVVSGLGLLMSAFVLWKQKRPPNNSLDGARGGE